MGDLIERACGIASLAQQRNADRFLADLLGVSPAPARTNGGRDGDGREPFDGDGTDRWTVVGMAGAGQRADLRAGDLFVRREARPGGRSWRIARVEDAGAAAIVDPNGRLATDVMVLRRTGPTAPEAEQDAPPAGTAAGVTAPAISPLFPGFDVSEWNGHIVWFWRWSNLRFIGFYLAHTAGGTRTSWTDDDHWHDLKDLGWGIVPLWVPFKGERIAEMATADGAAHGALAVARARAARIEQGAAVYLDIEAPVLSGATAKGARRYVQRWFRAVRDGGFTPGAYCSRLDAPVVLAPGFSDADPVLFPFSIGGRTRANWDNGRFELTPAPPSNWDTGTDPTWAPDPRTIGCQYDWFNSKRDRKVFHWPSATGTADTFRDVDWDAAKVPDPAHPRAAAGAVALAGDRGSPNTARVFVVRTDRIEHAATAAAGALSAPQGLGLGPSDIGPVPAAEQSGFDPASAAVVSRRTRCGDLFLLGLDGFVRTIWINERETFPRHPWPLNPDNPARKGSPIAAVCRETDQIDVFYFDREHHLVTQWWNPRALDWSRNRRVIPGTTVAGGSNVVALGRAAGPAAQAAGAPPASPSSLDVFYVGLDQTRAYAAGGAWSDAFQVVHARWSTAADWQLTPIAGLDRPAAASGVAAVRDTRRTIHVVAQTRDRRQLRHATLSAASATWDVLAGPGPLPARGEQTPWWMSLQLAAFPQAVVLVGVTSAGELACAAFASGHWSAVQTVASPLSTGRPIAVLARSDDALDVAGLDRDGTFVSRTINVLRDGTLRLPPAP
jgi:hypothetical protein